MANTTGYKGFAFDNTVGNSPGTYSNSNNFFPIEFNKAVILTMMQGDQGLGLRVNGGNDAVEHEGFVSSAFTGARCISSFGGGGVLASFDGYIGEMIVYNRVLKTSDRHEIEKYLSNKWKIQLR